MNVASKAPATPMTVLTRNPVGLFGPRDISRARTPATKPMIRIQRRTPIRRDPRYRPDKLPLRSNAFRIEAQPGQAGRRWATLRRRLCRLRTGPEVATLPRIDVVF